MVGNSQFFWWNQEYLWHMMESGFHHLDVFIYKGRYFFCRAIVTTYYRSSDEALINGEIIVKKRAKPNLSEASSKAYKNLHNTVVLLTHYKKTVRFAQELLAPRRTWDTILFPQLSRTIFINNMTRKLLNLQHDKTNRIM